MILRTMKLNPSVKRGLIDAVDKLARRPDSDPNEVVVLVIGQGQTLVGLPKARGRATSVRDVRRWVEAAVNGFASESSRPMAAGLSAAEAALLDNAGLEVRKPNQPGALERSRIEYELLLRDSLSLEQAAKQLGVSTSRLRQRLSAHVRSIYGIKDGREWRIPKFLFQKRGQLLRNIEKVLPHIRPDAHALAIQTWFATPHVDLTLGEDDKPIAPRAWLAAGRPADVVASLAEEI